MPHLSLEHYFTHPIYLMFASIAALFLGPLINAMFRGQRFVRDTIEGFTLVMIILLVAMYILPHTVHDVGFWAVIMLLIGMFLPSVFEKTYVRLASHVHYATIFVVMLGFATHAFLDGVALVTPSSICSIDAEHSVSMLPIAVLLHRLPEGLAIWTLIRPWYGNRRAILMLLISAISTVAGVTSGSLLISHIPHEPFGFFEALIAGLLLHILFHRHDPYEPSGCHDCETPKFDFKWGTGVGAILGFVLILAIQSSQHADHAHGSKAMIFWNLAFSSAPALVIAYLSAGLIHSFLPQASVIWMQKGGQLKQAFCGMMFGLPLTVCSCGVVPLYRSLVKKGLPLSAGIAFFIATPELGIDAILLTIPLLGTHFAAIRLLSAAIVALLVAVLIGLIFSEKKQHDNKAINTSNDIVLSDNTFWGKLKSGMWVGLADMVDHTGPWILFGLALAASIQPYLEQSRIFYAIPPAWQVPMFALLGMPIYICASGITPFVAVLIYHGVSPGAAIAFMLTGPATNATTFGILAQLHGKKIAITFAALVMLASCSVGYIINFFHITIPKILPLEHQHAFPAHTIAFFVMLTALYAFSLLRCGPQAWARKIIAGDVPAMEVHEDCKDEEAPHEHGHCGCGG